jgi:hypothetical protein
MKFRERPKQFYRAAEQLIVLRLRLYRNRVGRNDGRHFDNPLGRDLRSAGM